MRPNQSDCRISNLDQSEGRILCHVTWLGEKIILRSGTEFDIGLYSRSANMETRQPRVTSWQPEVTSSETGSERKSTTDHVVLAKIHFFITDLATVRHLPCLRHSFLSRSRRDTIGMCRDPRRVCRRLLCIVWFLRRSARC